MNKNRNPYFILRNDGVPELNVFEVENVMIEKTSRSVLGGGYYRPIKITTSSGNVLINLYRENKKPIDIKIERTVIEKI